MSSTPRLGAATSPHLSHLLFVATTTTTVGVATMGARQEGHVAQVRSQASTHATWKPWPHRGSTRSPSPSMNSARQIAHSKDDDDDCGGEQGREECCGSAGGTKARKGSEARLAAELQDVHGRGERRDERANGSGRSRGWIWCILRRGWAVGSDVTGVPGRPHIRPIFGLDMGLPISPDV